MLHLIHQLSPWLVLAVVLGIATEYAAQRFGK